jgi:hypothetical protein
MTMPQGSTEEPDDVVFTMPESIPVHVASSDVRLEKSISPEFGRWRTIIVSNVVGPLSATPGAQRLVNRSRRRHRTRIVVNASVVNQPVIDGVIIGSRDEITSGLPAVPGQLGGYLQIGDDVPYEAQAELYVCYPSTNTNSVYVTVCDEVYASSPESHEKKDE